LHCRTVEGSTTFLESSKNLNTSTSTSCPINRLHQRIKLYTDEGDAKKTGTRQTKIRSPILHPNGNTAATLDQLNTHAPCLQLFCGGGLMLPHISHHVTTSPHHTNHLASQQQPNPANQPASQARTRAGAAVFRLHIGKRTNKREHKTNPKALAWRTTRPATSINHASSSKVCAHRASFRLSLNQFRGVQTNQQSYNFNYAGTNRSIHPQQQQQCHSLVPLGAVARNAETRLSTHNMPRFPAR
jgi:hypothetical protein